MDKCVKTVIKIINKR